MSSSAGSTTKMEPVDARVPPSVKEEFEAAVREKTGFESGAARFELAREIRLRLDTGIEADIHEAVSDLADVYGQTDREKKFLETPDGKGDRVGYRVPMSVYKGIRRLAADTGRRPGEYVASVMKRYAKGESVDERHLNDLTRIKQADEHKFNDELDTTEQKTKQIADALDGSFTIAEFIDAVEPVKNLQREHALDRYLPRVLDELGYTWDHTTETARFVDADDVPPEDRRDPRMKPYRLMTDADKRAALKYELVTTGGLLTESDAIGVLDGRPQRTTIKSILRQIGETDGFGYGRGQNREKSNAEDRLKIDNRDAVQTSAAHERMRKALADDPEDMDTTDAGTADELDETEDMDADGGSPEVDDPDARDEDADGSTTDLTADDLATIAADLPDGINDYPDTLLANKIIRHTEDIDHPDDVPENPEDTVPDEQLSRVRRYVDNDAEEAGTTGPRGRVDADQTPMDTPDTTPSRDMDEIAAAEPVRTDGGSPEVDLGDPDAGDAG